MGADCWLWRRVVKAACGLTQNAFPYGFHPYTLMAEMG